MGDTTAVGPGAGVERPCGGLVVRANRSDGKGITSTAGAAGTGVALSSGSLSSTSEMPASELACDGATDDPHEFDISSSDACDWPRSSEH